jgi:Tol biopolymer transport system component/DNA-binding winged helix-turn-helix (wHTH) protein
VRDRSVYEFGDVRVDLGRMAAIRGDSVIPLEPKAFDVLVRLIEHRDRLVTKDELLDAVWTGTFVTPNVLTRAVAQIRKALGDETQDARYIETVAKRGYRFIAPVTVLAPGGTLQDLPPKADLPPKTGLPPKGGSHESGSRGGSRAARGSRRPAYQIWLAAAALIVVAGAAAAVLLLRHNTEADGTADLRLKRLTNRRGFSGTPAVAPDGHAVVYASDATGTLELYLANLSQGSGEVALTNDGGHNMQPAWSPDGQWIAFHSRRRGGVWVIPSTGGVPRQVVDFGSDPAWAPDSNTLVFTSDAGGLAGQSSLWTVKRDGTDRRALTQIGTPAGGQRAPVWSHGGRHVGFIVSHGGWTIEVWIVDVASGATHLVDVSTNASDPCFAPDDRAILWGGSTKTGNGRLFSHAIDADGNPVGATGTVLPMDAGIVEGLSLAADGTLAFSARNPDANLWAIDVGADGRGGQPVKLTDDVSRNTHPDYSDDGRVAYMQTAIGSLASVWVMREDGTARAPLVPGTDGIGPQWDRAGRRILMVRAVNGGWDFVWVDLASRRMTPAGLPYKDMMNPRLSPDAAAIAFHRIEKDGRMTVWTGGFDGTRTEVATDPEAVSYPAWSPDGKFLAVEIKRGDSTQIGVVARGGGPVEQLTTDRGQSWPHSWAPDNDRIVFAGQRDGVWNIYTVSRRTRAVVQLTSFTSGTGYVRYPAWSPTGSRIVFERAIESGNVWTLTLPSQR